MEQRPSCEANSSSATQEISCIVWNPNIHYHIYKIPPAVPIQSQIDLVHAPPFPHSTSLRSILVLSYHLHLDIFFLKYLYYLQFCWNIYLNQ